MALVRCGVDAFPRIRSSAAVPVSSFLAACLAAVSGDAMAVDIVGPAGSVHFGRTVKVLANGNIVVTDPDGPVSGVGAAYLYTPTGTLISTITGSQANDHVGSDGIVVLPGGNYLIVSTHWHNGAAADAGAVTWASASAGVSGVVSTSNSLIGTEAGDSVGTVAVLSNGNYVVSSPLWNNNGTADVGAATWGNAAGGTMGPVSAGNSIVGSNAADYVGSLVTALTNGNFVVGSPLWDNGNVADAGAATWASGSSSTAGAVTAANSLVGTTAFDRIGATVTALSNGNYVVGSQYWNNGAIASAGAATWGNGGGGTVGAVSSANSIVGDADGDGVGAFVNALANGNYVVRSPNWSNAGASGAGAVTWFNGNGGAAGVVSAANSLVGGSAGDLVGLGLTVLGNGNYVVVSPYWHNGNTAGAGASTWRNGSATAAGIVSASNSLVGGQAGDGYESFATALGNGNYVVSNPAWDNAGTADAGAVTWGDGSGGVAGAVSASNALVGTSTGDAVGSAITALSNGNYVVGSRFWDNGGSANAGAATFARGNASTSAVVSPANSLVGATSDDKVGLATALSNGDYVLLSPFWDEGAIMDAGAATLGNGAAGTTGILSPAQSLAGTSTGDAVGSSVTALSNGGYVVSSPDWDNGMIADAGAITLRRASDRLGATITALNSVIGLVASGGSVMRFDYDATRDQLVVGRPNENIVTLFKADLLFRGTFD